MRFLFSISILVNAFLLFSVQPMIAKALLPSFGGAPAVWLVSMVFFQGALLAGYGYGHFVGKLGKRQVWVHLALLALAAITLPFRPPLTLLEELTPSLRVLLILTLSVGPTFLLVSAGAPLMQRWFAATDDPWASRPYFLYSASNLGSMAALIAYPFFIEPRFRLSEQFQNWAVAFGVLWALVLTVGVVAQTRWQDLAPASAKEATPEEPIGPGNSRGVLKERLRWIALAAVPSALLLGVTNFLTANVAPVPMLWVVPLALYLLTYTIGFARRPLLKSAILGRIVPLLVAPLLIPVIMESVDGVRMEALAAFHLVTFFFCAWMCHAELSETAPTADRTTEFYFFLALGGVVGGAATALLSPLVFDVYAEYPYALALACMVRPLLQNHSQTWAARAADWIYPLALGVVAYVLPQLIPGAFWAWVREHQGGSVTQISTLIHLGLPVIFVFLASDRPFRQGLALAAVYTATYFNQIAIGGTRLLDERSFFGTHRVNRVGNFHSLVHGNTLHGRQNLKKPDVPSTYYHPSGPIGQVFESLDSRIRRAALVGLGVGSLAAYNRPGRTLTFYEIDPMVVQTASNAKYFTFLLRSKGDLNIVLGDGRKMLERSEFEYDLIVLDAFSSDAIPGHLVTVEALQAYVNHLTPNGVIAFHISNRYLSLKEILAAAAKQEGLQVRLQADFVVTDEQEEDGKTSSQWLIVARNESDFGKLEKSVDWERFEAPEGTRPWTDDYSNLLQAFLLKRTED